MTQLAGKSTLDVWYSRIDVAACSPTSSPASTTGSKTDKRMADRTGKIMTKARTRDSLQALDKLTHLVDGQRRIVSDPPLIVPAEEVFPESGAMRSSRSSIISSCANTARAFRQIVATCSRSSV